MLTLRFVSSHEMQEIAVSYNAYRLLCYNQVIMPKIAKKSRFNALKRVFHQKHCCSSRTFIVMYRRILLTEKLKLFSNFEIGNSFQLIRQEKGQS